MKFSTAWGNLKPAKVIDDCSQRSGTDSAKIIILDSLYKVCNIKYGWICLYTGHKQSCTRFLIQIIVKFIVYCP